MDITLVQPTIGRVGGNGTAKKLRRPFTFEPLGIAVLAGVTPDGFNLNFFDDRFEDIDYDRPTDLVGISVETSTALRAYEIAKHYRDKGVKVVMGGVHPTLLPDEVANFADVVVSGHAERTWPALLRDLKCGEMRSRYSESDSTIDDILIDRKILSGRRYLPANLVEFGRGCPFRCEFCDIPVYFDGKFNSRPTDHLLRDIASSEREVFVIVDDNLGSNRKALENFCNAIKPLAIKWVAQTSIVLAHNERLIALMAESGCIGVLIGLESIDSVNLALMNKGFNEKMPIAQGLNRFMRNGIRIHGSFIVGYDNDTAESVEELVDFAIAQKLFIANFNPLIPIPKTALYERLKFEGRLFNPKWWLDYNFRYGDFVFEPKNASVEEMSEICEKAKRRFYSLKSISSRGYKSLVNCKSWKSALYYLGLNLMTRKEVTMKKDLYLGLEKTISCA